MNTRKKLPRHMKRKIKSNFFFLLYSWSTINFIYFLYIYRMHACLIVYGSGERKVNVLISGNIGMDMECMWNARGMHVGCVNMKKLTKICLFYRISISIYLSYLIRKLSYLCKKYLTSQFIFFFFVRLCRTISFFHCHFRSVYLKSSTRQPTIFHAWRHWRPIAITIPSTYS